MYKNANINNFVYYGENWIKPVLVALTRSVYLFHKASLMGKTVYFSFNEGLFTWTDTTEVL